MNSEYDFEMILELLEVEIIELLEEETSLSMETHPGFLKHIIRRALPCCCFFHRLGRLDSCA